MHWVKIGYKMGWYHQSRNLKGYIRTFEGNLNRIDEKLLQMNKTGYEGD